MDSERKNVGEKTCADEIVQEHKSESGGSDESLEPVGAGGKGKSKKHSSSSSSSASSSSKKSNKSSAQSSSSTKKFRPGDPQWATDLPPGFEENHKDWFEYLSDAIDQGKLSICWAVAIARCIQASLAIRGIKVELSPQHLINSIKSKSRSNGQIIKYEEISNFLKYEGLVLEEVCPFSGKIDETCPKECFEQTSDDSFYKIREFNRMKRKEIKEEVLIPIVHKRPIIAIIDCYKSFLNYKSGIYKGHDKRKDEYVGRHAVLVYGYGTTEEGEHYWLVQNSLGKNWGQNGLGKMIRKCSRNQEEPSLFVNAIDIMV